jgi:hypothetical protein
MEKDRDEKHSLDHAGTPTRSLEELPKAEETVPSSATTQEDAQPEYEYITGTKLWLVLASVTLVVFLAMLDMSIIVTVGLCLWS